MTTKSLNKYYNIISAPYLVLLSCNAPINVKYQLTHKAYIIFLSILKKNCGPVGHVDIDSEPGSVFLKYLRPWAGS
jgi:hypothetical protein